MPEYTHDDRCMIETESTEDAYKPLLIGENYDGWPIDETYHVLVGPDFECTLTEPEDRTWCRDGAAVVKRLNEQHRRIREQDEEIKRLRRFVTDQSKTCYSCEVCGHARTTRECLRCDIKELRELCGDAIDFVRFSSVSEITTPKGVTNRAEMLVALDNAASKGKQ